MKKEYLNEIWKPIKGYEGLYEVSNWGRVKSLERYNLSNRLRKGRILKQKQCMDGYKSVTLYKDGKRKIILVHRLVAEAFIPNPNNYPYVNHKDEQKDNNVVSNLEWCTSSYNQTYGTCRKKIKQKVSKPLIQYTLDGEFVKEWESVNDTAKYGWSRQLVRRCCRGERQTYKGFIWKYK